MRRSRVRAGLVSAAVLSVGAVLMAAPAGASGQPAATTAAQGTAPAQETAIVVLATPCPPGATTSEACPAQAPVLAQLQASGATVVSTTQLVDTITAQMTAAEAATLSAEPGVSSVTPDSAVNLGGTGSPSSLGSPSPDVAGTANGRETPPAVAPPGSGPAAGDQAVRYCGTQRRPELDPEALQAIDAAGARFSGVTGRGVTVAVLTDGLDPANPDLLRSAAYGVAGSPVVTNYEDFSGDGTAAPTAGGEAFLDAGSIAAQGNVEYNLADFVSPGQAARMPASGCWVRILGAAPGADVMALKVIAQSDQTTTSAILQAIQYAVAHGAKVINESFGTNPFPDTSLDVVREADDAAVAAGVTVVVATGDSGVTSTIGSPASDPNVISVGATTTFRAYAQDNSGGFYNPAVGNGRFADNNISSLSSSGYTQAGNTVNLVAPGDLNWALCSAEPSFSDCVNESGQPSSIQLSGGTSEAAPLTAAAAADVIQAYAGTHGGNDPAPALVKQILTSTATDINAPADQQGAGLLNITAAVRLAASIRTPGTPPVPGGAEPPAPDRATFWSGPAEGPSPPPATSDWPDGHRRPWGGDRRRVLARFGSDLLLGPSQINVAAAPGTASDQQVSVTNESFLPQVVRLATRALTTKLSDTGVQTFQLDPSTPTTNTGTMQIWSGATEVFQKQTFTVPPAGGDEPTRLVFSADYQYTGQNSVLHVALYSPDGTYEGYTNPQGLADYAETEVADPQPGTWTAIFFTAQNGTIPGAVGTSGPVQWDASTWQYAPASSITPSTMFLMPGQCATATLGLVTPATAGDSSESVVVSSRWGQATIPVTIRSTIPIGPSGGTFSGVLSGGNGRAGAEAQTNTYRFQVPAGVHDLDTSIALATDPGDLLTAQLVDPNGQTVSYSSNYTLVPTATGLAPGATQYAQLYHLDPLPGTWSLVLDWANPVTGNELTEPFTGAIRFDQVSVTSNLPDSSSASVPASGGSYQVTVDNTGVAPEAYFVDPRLDQTTTIDLANQNPAVDAASLQLPLPASSTAATFPYYLVPPQTTELQAQVDRLSGPSPATFDMSYFPGDPDVSPNQPAPGVTATATATSSALTLTEPSQVSPGLWGLVPAETGPYPPSGAPADSAGVSVSAVTQAFDPAVTSNTDDFWQQSSNPSASFSNVLYLLPGQSGQITVDITPTAAAGGTGSGTLYVDDFTLASLFGAALPNGDEIAAIPYRYSVG